MRAPRRTDAGDAPTRARWLAPLTGAATVLVVVGLVIAIRHAAHDTPAAGPTPAAPGSSSSVRGGTREVTRAGVSVTVPLVWADRYGPEPGSWCTGTAPTTPYVEIPARGTRAARCLDPVPVVPAGFPAVPERLWAPHLSLTRLADEAESVRDGTATYDGWTLTTRTVGEGVVRLLTDAATAGEIAPIMGSVTTAG